MNLDPAYIEHLNSYIWKTSNLIILDVDGEGIIRSANQYARYIAGKDISNQHLSVFFTDFNAALDIQRLQEEDIHQQLLNINTFHGLPQTLYFTSFRRHPGFLLIGEMSSLEVEELRNTMLSLNNELNNLTRELQKKNIQLDQLNQLKNQFLGMAAHDLRNPIGSIMMFSEFILDELGDEISPEIQKIIDIIRTSSQYMLHLLDELLDVVKIESGKMELKMEDVHLIGFLRKNLEINNIMAARKNIKISLNVPDTSLYVRFDPLKMEQVMNNLISNAIKYSANGTTITIGAFVTNTEILISVQDQGQGIPKEEMDLLFRPFAKISVQSTGGEKSTGLGLSIVKKIIIGHLGRIWVESEVGKGTTFFFSLPINKEPLIHTP